MKKLSDYKETDFLVSDVKLEFDIFDDKTIVSNSSRYQKNPRTKGRSVVLNGAKLKLLDFQIDDAPFEQYQIKTDENSEIELSFSHESDSFVLKTVVEINPKDNKSLEGLYVGDGVYCTQNEPEGFRQIALHPDRPDVMSKYATTIKADKKRYPHLLSNGNPVEKGDLEDGRHYVTWEDPFAKPCYLFALVAGDLAKTSDSFITQSGKAVKIDFFCDKGNEARLAHAMESLKLAMKWDEDTFGLEYDLDRYMVVAIDAFNMGAMENKSLNIFNARAVLCDEKSSQDHDFRLIRDIIGHEYFHNWTGNRITCKNWFHLSLKEGLTVYREHRFAADMGDPFIKRIEEAKFIKEVQFKEAAGPMSHPVLPKEYSEINNFYTPTIYQKGSELIGMIETFIGREAFGKGMDAYIKDYDGQAVGIEEFILSMEKASFFDLKSFRKWYDQKRTPVVQVTEAYREGTLILTLEQSIKEPGVYNALPIPILAAFFNKDGEKIETRCGRVSSKEHLLILKDKKQDFIIENVYQYRASSLLRRFSAPVVLLENKTIDDYLFLYAYDDDGYVRHASGEQAHIMGIEEVLKRGKTSIAERVAEIFKTFLAYKDFNEDYLAYLIDQPRLDLAARTLNYYDYPKLGEAQKIYTKAVASKIDDELKKAYNRVYGAEGNDEISARHRALEAILLWYVCDPNLAYNQYFGLKRIDHKISALSVINSHPGKKRDEAFSDFYSTWKDDNLVICKYFTALTKGETSLKTIESALNDEVFSLESPNKVKALLGSYLNNFSAFHKDYEGSYPLLAQIIVKIDGFNPNLSSLLVNKAFSDYANLPPYLKKPMKDALETVKRGVKSRHALEQVEAVLTSDLL